MILACDHPARYVTNVGDDPRHGRSDDYLGRITRVLIHDEGYACDFDIVEDLLIVSAVEEKTGKGLLDDKVILGCMNRALSRREV